MSKKRVTKKTAIKPTKRTVVKPTETVEEVAITKSNNSALLFGKTNYMLILGGFLLMVIGFVLMSGGSMPDANTWDEDIIYGARRTVFAPIFILAGLVVQVFAIFKKNN